MEGRGASDGRATRTVAFDGRVIRRRSRAPHSVWPLRVIEGGEFSGLLGKSPEQPRIPFVMPAKAGIHRLSTAGATLDPVCAGMTSEPPGRPWELGERTT
jgi:hypothetical protein